MTFRKTRSHKGAESTAFTCGTCHKTSPSHHGLLRHIRRNHRGTAFQCYYCDFTTKFKECLVRHVRSHLFKKEVVRPRGAYVKCPLCEFGCTAREIMIKHYVDDHDVDIKEQYVEFPDTEQFLKWKYEVEQSDVCQFTSCSKKNRDAVNIRYYRCFRDGVFQRKGKGIRNMKLKGSLKINGICPAGMKVEESKATGAVKVSFIRSHVGHSHELGLLTLSKSERAEIARKLSMGMTHEEILGGIRGSLDANLKRVHLITRKDVWNVQSSFGLPKARTKRVKEGKATKALDGPSSRDQPKLEDVRGSETSMIGTDVGSIANVSLPDKSETLLEHGPQENSQSVETSVNHVWGVQHWTASHEPDSFYSAQSVPEKGNMAQTSYDLDSSKNMPYEHASAEVCELSSDNDGHYFEVIIPDLPDSRIVPSENPMNERKTRIGSKIEEILDMIKTEEQADLFYNELLVIQETILKCPSIANSYTVETKQ